MRTGAEGGGCFPTGRHYPGIAHLLRIIAAGLADEFPGETAMADLALISIDTETTGKNPTTDRIVEVACVVWRGGAVVTRGHWLVNPGCSIPADAFEVHGIGDDDVRDKPPFVQVAGELCDMLSGGVPVAYNAEFDRAFLAEELSRAGFSGTLPPAARRGVEWIDPLVWARELQKDEKGKSLGEVAGRLGVGIERAHRARDDAEAALRVLEAFFGDHRVPRTYAAFVQEQRRLARLQGEDRAYWRNAPLGAGMARA